MKISNIHLSVTLSAALLISIPSIGFAAKTFVYCSEGSPSSFNPQLVSDDPSNVVAANLYNGLVEFEPGETGIAPRLAESWTISANNLEYTFKLRKNVKFHTTSYFKPTRDMNADDVLFSFNRMRLDSHPYHMVGGALYGFYKSTGMDQELKDLQKIDDYTVKFTLSNPDATFLPNLAMQFAAILSAEYADKLTAAKTPQIIDVEPVGTGPFFFQRYEKDSIIRLAANPYYFLGKSKLDNLIFVITPDANVRTQKLKVGECNLIAEPSPADYEQFVSDKNLKVTSVAGMNIGYLSFNVEKKPFNNLLVRKAISHALNRKSYIDAIFKGFGQIAKSPMPPTVLGYSNQAMKYDYNPKKAKDLLKEAGYSDGFTTELWALPVSRPYNPDGKKMAEMMQSDLAAIGVKAKIVTFDWPTYLAKVKTGEHTMAQMGWTSDNGDPDSFLYQLLSCDAIKSGNNRSRWCDEKFDSYVTQAKFTTDQNKRIELYKKAQDRFRDEVPWALLAHSTIMRVMQKKVVGYKLDPVARDRFYGVDLKE